MLHDMTSTAFHAFHAPPLPTGPTGHLPQGRRGGLPIGIGPVCIALGYSLAVEVFEGFSRDPMRCIEHRERGKPCRVQRNSARPPEPTVSGTWTVASPLRWPAASGTMCQRASVGARSCSADGGGIYDAATLTVRDTTVSGDVAIFGAGILNGTGRGMFASFVIVALNFAAPASGVGIYKLAAGNDFPFRKSIVGDNEAGDRFGTVISSGVDIEIDSTALQVTSV